VVEREQDAEEMFRAKEAKEAEAWKKNSMYFMVYVFL
jgi:hypothetical protein